MPCIASSISRIESSKSMLVRSFGETCGMIIPQVLFWLLLINNASLSWGQSTELSKQVVLLAEQNLQLTDNEDTYRVNVGSIRAGMAYELKVAFENHRNTTFLPKKVRVSCNCVVGAFDSEPVEPGKSGSFLVRLQPKDGGGEIGQTILIEPVQGKPFSILVVGKALPCFTFVGAPYRVPKLDASVEIETILEAQYEEIDLSTLEIASLSAALELVKSEIHNRSGVATFRVREAPRRDFISEILVLRFEDKHGDTVFEQRIGLTIRSKEVVARPTILRLSKVGERDGSSIWEGSFTIFNAPDDFHTLDKAGFSASQVGDSIKLQSSLKSISKQQFSHKCSFEISIPKNLEKQSEKGDWLLLSLSIGGLDFIGMRCVLGSD